jgi:hypothetical protein
MISLVGQIKKGIEEGKWSSILSDDVGGRIPSLVLRKILQEKGPGKSFKIFFLAAGQGMPGWEYPDEEDFSMSRDYPEPRISGEKDYENLKKYLASLDFGDERVLIVTEYAFKGKTMEKIGLAMGDAKVGNKFDFAIMHNTGFSDVTQRLEAFKHMSGSKIFIGEENYGSQFSEGHKELSGVRKAKAYSPIPVRTLDKIKKEGEREITNEEFKKIFGTTDEVSPSKKFDNLNDPKRVKEYNRKKKEPLTPEEEQEIQKKINLAREDVDTMAKKVVEQVWK